MENMVIYDFHFVLFYFIYLVMVRWWFTFNNVNITLKISMKMIYAMSCIKGYIPS